MQLYNSIDIWILMVICGVITFLIRFSFLKFANDTLIENMKEFLSYMPASIFAAIITGGVFNKGINSISVDNFKIYAMIFALFIAFKFKNTILTICSGLAILWGLNFINRLIS